MRFTFYVVTTAIFFSCAAFSGGNRMIVEEYDPGYQYVIGNKYGVLHQESGGLADLRKSDEMTFENTMSAFSMTKTFTAIAILQLAENKTLSLDDSVNKWINTPYPDTVKVRHLITHTSGISNPLPLNWVHFPQEHKSFNEDLFFEVILDENKRLKGEPGKKYLYSNIGYWLAGKVIESASGLAYQKYILKNIFEPLAITSSQVSFHMNEATMAKGYLKRTSLLGLLSPLIVDKKLLGTKSGKWRKVESVYLNGPAYGGLFAKADGIFIILNDLLQEESALLGKDSKHLLFSQQNDLAGKPISMTLGWHVGEAGGMNFLFKEGGGAGYHSEMRIYPNIGYASVIMSNRTSFDVKTRLNHLDQFHINDSSI
jgi:CubicO group peptidase (beta-lactamase class C family)